MYQKNRYLFSEIRKTRLLIYSVLLVLLVVYNVTIDFVNNDSIRDIILESIIFVPTISLGLLLLLVSQKWIMNTTQSISLSYKSKIVNPRTIKIFGFLIASFLISSVIRTISYFIMNDEENERFFNSILFLYLLITLTTFGIIFLIENLLVKVITEKRLRSDISEIEYERNKFQQIILKKQLSPHFLFNSFSSLLGLIQKSPDDAEKFVIHLANIYRSSMHKDDELVITLQEEYNNSDSYLQLMMMRHPDAIRPNIVGDMDSTEYFLPPLTLLSLIENAVKHNAFSKEQPLMLTIKREKDTVVVSNVYKPRSTDSTRNGGTGKENLAKQFRLLEYPEPEYKIENDLFQVKIHLITIY